MHPKSWLCENWNCRKRNKAAGGVCQGCQSKLHHTRKRIEREGLIVDTAGGLWWIWTAKGEVLVLGKATRGEAVRSLAWDGEHEDKTVGATAP